MLILTLTNTNTQRVKKTQLSQDPEKNNKIGKGNKKKIEACTSMKKKRTGIVLNMQKYFNLE